MDFRQLRYFLKIAEKMSISAAAKELHISQPALSKQLKAFEQQMGWSLIDRGARSIQLTHAGKVVEEEGRRVTDYVDKALARMQQQIDGPELAVGYAPTLGGELLKQVMPLFADEFPAVRVRLHDMNTEEMRRGMRSGSLDLALEVAMGEEDIDWTPLQQHDLVAAVPKQMELSTAKVLTPESLDGVRLLLLSRDEYPGYWKSVTNYFVQHGVNAKVAGEFDGASSLTLGLEAGLGVALVSVGGDFDDSIELVPLDPSPEPVCVAVGCSNEKRVEPWVSRFIELLQEVAKNSETKSE